jgi:hypothetical protein
MKSAMGTCLEWEVPGPRILNSGLDGHKWSASGLGFLVPEKCPHRVEGGSLWTMLNMLKKKILSPPSESEPQSIRPLPVTWAIMFP